MIAGAWLFLKGAYDVLMRISVPLLLAGLVLLTVSGGLIWKWGVADHARKRAEARAIRLDGSLAETRTALAACHASVDELTRSLEMQNAAVDALKADSDERTRRASAALKRAQEQTRGLRAQVVRLERARPYGDVCTSARTLIVETLREERS